MYQSNKEILSKVDGYETAKRVANNTLEIEYSDGRRAIRLHDTNVITFYPDGSVVLNSGGFRTQTTKDRINKFQNETYISQKNHVWYLEGGEVFEDGITLKDGKVISDLKDGEESRILELKKSINQFVNLIDEMADIPMPSSGDCFYCAMTSLDDDSKCMGDVLGDHEHLLSHIEEGYIPGALVFNALIEKGVTPKGIQFIYSTNNKYSVKLALRRYLHKRLI